MPSWFLTKCELWWLNHDPAWSQFPQSIQRSSASGTDLLGSAVGDSSFQNAVLAKRVSKIADMLKALQDVDCAQTKLHLLRSCLGFPKFSFALRTMHSDYVQENIDRFDLLMRDALEDILGVVVDDVTRAQISLPIGDGFGGFGIPSAKYVADAAFVASLDTVSFQLLCRYHLGIPLYPLSGKACSLCGGSCDCFGDHFYFFCFFLLAIAVMATYLENTQ